MQPPRVWGVMSPTRYVVGASALIRSFATLTPAPQFLRAARVAKLKDQDDLA